MRIRTLRRRVWLRDSHFSQDYYGRGINVVSPSPRVARLGVSTHACAHVHTFAHRHTRHTHARARPHTPPPPETRAPVPRRHSHRRPERSDAPRPVSRRHGIIARCLYLSKPRRLEARVPLLGPRWLVSDRRTRGAVGDPDVGGGGSPDASALLRVSGRSQGEDREPRRKEGSFPYLALLPRGARWRVGSQRTTPFCRRPRRLPQGPSPSWATSLNHFLPFRPRPGRRSLPRRRFRCRGWGCQGGRCFGTSFPTGRAPHVRTPCVSHPEPRETLTLRGSSEFRHAHPPPERGPSNDFVDQPKGRRRPELEPRNYRSSARSVRLFVLYEKDYRPAVSEAGRAPQDPETPVRCFGDASR